MAAITPDKCLVLTQGVIRRGAQIPTDGSCDTLIAAAELASPLELVRGVYCGTIEGRAKEER